MGKFLNLFSKGESCQLLINLEGKHVSRYQFFKVFLDHNHGALSLIAELEQMYYNGRPFSLVDKRYIENEPVLEYQAENPIKRYAGT